MFLHQKCQLSPGEHLPVKVLRNFWTFFLSFFEKYCMMLGMRVLLTGVAIGGLATMGLAQPKYFFETRYELPLPLQGSGAYVQQFSMDGSFVAAYSGDGENQWVWDRNGFHGTYFLENIQLNSSGEVVRKGQFRRTIDGAVEQVPKFEGINAMINGLNDRGEVFGHYPVDLGGMQGETGGIPFIYNFRTSTLTIPPKPAEHTEPNGMVTDVDNMGRYIIMGWVDFPGQPIGSTFVEPGRITRFGMRSAGAAMLNNTGGCVFVNRNLTATYFMKGGVFTVLPESARYIGDDDTFLYNPESNNEPWIGKVIGTQVTGWSLKANTLNLPSDVTLYSSILRTDGTLAAITERGGKFSISTFTPVPEPGSLAVLGIGCLALRRRGTAGDSKSST